MVHPSGFVRAPSDLSARVRALAETHGLRRLAAVCSVDRDTLLATMARWPQRTATVAVVRIRIAELEERGYPHPDDGEAPG